MTPKWLEGDHCTYSLENSDANTKKPLLNHCFRVRFNFPTSVDGVHFKAVVVDVAFVVVVPCHGRASIICEQVCLCLCGWVSVSVTRKAIYWTYGNFSKPLATINLPKSPTFLGNFCFVNSGNTTNQKISNH